MVPHIPKRATVSDTSNRPQPEIGRIQADYVLHQPQTHLIPPLRPLNRTFKMILVSIWAYCYKCIYIYIHMYHIHMQFCVYIYMYTCICIDVYIWGTHEITGRPRRAAPPWPRPRRLRCRRSRCLRPACHAVAQDIPYETFKNRDLEPNNEHSIYIYIYTPAGRDR